MKNVCIGIVAALVCPLAWAGNACVAVATGNWSAAATWTSCGGTVPGNGDTATITGAYTVTVDVNTTVGQSGPGIGVNGSIPSPSLTDTAGGGSLPGGAYKAIFTFIDAAGKESAPSNEASLTLTAGDTLTVTLPTLPTGKTSMNLYLTAAGGASGTETLYATGITGTSFAAVNSLWDNNTVAQASAPSLPLNWAINMNIPAGSSNALVIATGVTLTLRGDALLNSSTFTIDCGSTLEWDSSASNGTTNNPYTIFGPTGNASITVQSASGCSANPWSITSNVSGANGQFLGGGSGYGTSIAFNLSYGTVSHCGGASWNCMQSQYRGITLDHVIFTGDGRMEFQNAGTTSITNSTWENALDGEELDTYGAASGAVYTGNVFDQTPRLGMGTATFTNNYLDESPNPYGTATTISGDFFRQTTGNQFNAPGAISQSYFLADNWPTAAVTSTATSGTSTTITDTTQSWTANQYANDGAGNGWSVLITGGTGANQLRGITSNTTNTLTIGGPPLSPAPDSTSTYAIYDLIGNLHFLGVVQGDTYSHNIFDFTGTNSSGKMYLASSLTAPGTTLTYNIGVPNGQGSASAGLFTFGSTAAANNVVAQHNTTSISYFVGAYVDDYVDTAAAGYIASYASNLFWVGPAYSASTQQCANVKMEDANHCSSGGVQNYGLPANIDYNACWNCNTGTYLGNGYSINMSTQAGVHDVNLSGTTAASGPNFVDPTRNFLTWCESLGLTGIRTTVLAACRANMMKRNDLNGDWDSRYNISALMTWVTAGYAPQNAALHNTAADGTDIGAVPYQAPATSRHRAWVIQ